MNRQEHAAEICRAVGSPHVKILADFFHMHIEERSLAGALRQVGPYLGYIHVADSNRLEPGAGFQDFRTPFAALKEVGYDGWITVESGASGDPETALREANQRLREWWEEA
jgi:sugar phosphate isomerase/epimerase